MQFYRRALQSDPSYSRAAGNLGQLIDHQREVGDAVEELQQLAELDTDNLDLQYRLALALSRTDRHKAAERVLLRILSLDTRHLEATRLLADVYLRTGRDAEAEQCYRRLKTINSDYVEHHLDRARTYQRRGEPRTGLRDAEEYLEAKPGDLDGLMMKASLLVDVGRQTEALEILEELRNLYPGDGRVLAAIASAHQRGGEREEAIRAVDELINLQGSRATPEDIEALNESLELYEQAVDAFAEEFQLDWERNLNRLGELAQPEEEEDEGELAVDEQVSLDEDSIPILSFGGEELIEPDEWEVSVRADEEEEDEDYLGMEPPEQLAPSLATLPEQQHMRGGESFAEGLRRPYDQGGLSASQPPTQPPPARPQPPSQPPPQPQPAAPPPPPAAGPQEPYPNGTPSPPASPPAGRDAAPPAEHAPPPVEAAPRDEQQPAEPPAGPPPDHGSPIEPDADLVDVPEDFEVVPDADLGPEEQPELELGEEDAESWEEQWDELLEEPSGLEAREPEPELDAGYDEAVPTIDDLLAAAEEAGSAEAPAGEAPAGEAPDDEAPDDEASTDVASDDEAPAGEAPDDEAEDGEGPARLLDYLSTMATSLPQEKRSEYMASEERLKLEYLRARLAGRRGLHEDGARYAPEDEEAVTVPLTKRRVRDTLAYIGEMSRYHPDRSIGTALSVRVGAVLEQLRRLREDARVRDTD
jgi:tetratricopeptide (TPR) repeat protein